MKKMKKILLLVLAAALLFCCASCSRNVIMKEETVECDNCGESVPEDSAFCPYCGINLDGSSTNKVTCVNCGEEVPEGIKYCPYCGENPFEKAISEAEKFLGTWTTNDEWGKCTYIFYANGYCQGEYLGGTGGVEPSLFPRSMDEGCGNGSWKIEEGQITRVLVVSYNGDKWGDHAGTQRYEYEFNDDCTQLTIYGVPTNGDRVRQSAVWTKES